ncbi:hypothetical protein M434DRAFT_33071 [Hypoxylon sp. CO27-5]|nr:hypothetical protein M434DRAFT_33071 [Hypoxylon sp. CO27-5]
MGSLDLSRRRNNTSTGWKQAARINCIVLILMSATLMGSLIAAVSQVGSIQRALFFYAGDCDNGNVTQVNIALHLLINVVSTLVVINSPSRDEVNIAHLKGSWLGIGVPSARNVFHVSKFKTLCWIVLLASSIPIHLLFNSAIFETDHRESDFHLTIGTEEFINGGIFYPPGASLLPSGGGLLTPLVLQSNYGNEINLTDYASKGSDAVKNISATAVNAYNWKRLETQDCKQEYISCAGLKNHRSLALIVDKPGGWVRDGTYESPIPNIQTCLSLNRSPFLIVLSEHRLTDRQQMWHFKSNQTKLWDQYVPSNESNHLFFDAQCTMVAERTQGQPIGCLNNCMAALTGTQYHLYDPSIANFTVAVDVSDWGYSFFDSNAMSFLNDSDGDYSSALQPGAFDLSIQYCLAEPLDRICHIALSPALLMGTTICVIVKSCTAILVTIVLIRQKQTPLVTPGDAMASFIEKPDTVTAGLCTFGQGDVRRALKDKNAFLPSGPRRWHPLQKRRAVAVPISVWVTSYLLFVIAVIVCASYYALAYDSSRGLWGSFFESDQNVFFQNPFTFLGGVITANGLQLLLSLWYLAYNNLFTRLQMAREWALFSEGYHPLRVTDPQGEQYATYRLQLPYKYSLPLIAVSIFLHWLLSNTIYLFISTGGYYGTSNFISGAKVDSSLPPNTAIAVGYSLYSLMTLLIASCVLILIPILPSLKRLPPNMVNIGNNSFALSAACHVSKLSHAVKPPESAAARSSTEPSRSPSREGSRAGNIEMQQLVMTRQSSSQQSLASERLVDHQSQEDSDEQSLFRDLTRSEIRWGVVRMPPEWHSEYEREGVVVEHLSFGVRGDDVRDPVRRRLYA